MPSHPYEFSALSDVGLVRPGNEDSYALLSTAGIAIVADGMGGHAGGEVASAIAVSTVARTLLEALAEEPTAGNPLRFATTLDDAVRRANHAVLEAGQQNEAHAGMGTTLLIARFGSARITVCHVGDCRFYRFLDGRLELLTCDHTLGSLLARRVSGNGLRQAGTAHDHMLVNAIGTRPAPAPDMIELKPDTGAIYLLCSDGLNALANDEQIRLTLMKFGANLEITARRLVDLANDLGGNDNTTVVLARQRPTDPDLA